MDFEPPYWIEGTPAPPENIEIGHYQIRALISTKRRSYIYTCYDSRKELLKEMEFVKITEESREKLQNYISILRTLQYPTIIETSDFIRYDAYLCIVFDVPTPNVLLSEYMKDNQDGIREDICISLMYQMLKAINHIHQLGICHRNIKLESFILDTREQERPEGIRVLLTNFGLADFIHEGSTLSEFVGSTGYIAPEIINRNPYNQSVDIWSLGITFFYMLSGRMPFPIHSLTPQETFNLIRNGDLDYTLLTRLNISNDAIDLIRHMCNTDPASRITAFEALSYNLFDNVHEHFDFDHNDNIFTGHNFSDDIDDTQIVGE